MIGFTFVSQPDEAVYYASPMVVGDDELIDRIRSGADARLKEAHKDQMLMRFLNDPPEAKMIGQADGLQIIDRLLALSRLLKESSAGTSVQKTEAALISPGGIRKLSDIVAEPDRAH